MSKRSNVVRNCTTKAYTNRGSCLIRYSARLLNQSEFDLSESIGMTFCLPTFFQVVLVARDVYQRASHTTSCPTSEEIDVPSTGARLKATLMRGAVPRYVETA
jgi:hypothetical protein